MRIAITPTVGRVVHFFDPRQRDTSAGPLKPLAALIAAVHDNDDAGRDRITVGYFTAKGHAANARDIILVQDGELPPDDPNAPWAEWMDHQKGQAAKTDATEKILSSVLRGDKAASEVFDKALGGQAAPPLAPANPAMVPSSLATTEAASAAVAKAPRVALADIEAAIESRYDFTAAAAVKALEMPVSADGPLGVLSICLLTMRNGFTVIGKSAPASSENFNADLGRQYAYEDAVRQIWPLMGFSLRERLCASAGTPA